MLLGTVSNLANKEKLKVTRPLFRFRSLAVTKLIKFFAMYTLRLSAMFVLSKIPSQKKLKCCAQMSVQTI